MNIEDKLKGHFLNLYHMALADNEVDNKELEMLYKIGDEKGITKTEIDSVLFTSDSVKFILPETVLEKIESLYDLARIAWADGKIDENEERIMQVFSRKFGFEDENIPTIIQFLLDEAKKGTSKEDIFKIVTENL
jgi:uncharacterized tellurite resistance protein B-like protein